MAHPKPDRKRVVLLATNSSRSIIGEIVDGKTNTIAYSTYGEQSAQQDIETRLGFNGQLREGNIGWYLLGNGYRAYNPRLMRFHSPDSWSPFGGGGLNAYMYCVGDPVNRSDPTGHNPFVALGMYAKHKLSKAYSGYKPHPDFNVNLESATNGLYEMQKNVKSEQTHGASAVSQAASYIFGPKPGNKFIGKYPPKGDGSTHGMKWGITPPFVPSRPRAPQPASPPRSVRFNKSVKQHDGPTNPPPNQEHNQLQGAEAPERRNLFPSNESIASTESNQSTGSTYYTANSTNASNSSRGSNASINSDRYERAEDLRFNEELLQRVNALERDGDFVRRGGSNAGLP